MTNKWQNTQSSVHSSRAIRTRSGVSSKEEEETQIATLSMNTHAQICHPEVSSDSFHGTRWRVNDNSTEWLRSKQTRLMRRRAWQ